MNESPKNLSSSTHFFVLVYFCICDCSWVNSPNNPFHRIADSLTLHMKFFRGKFTFFSEGKKIPKSTHSFALLKELLIRRFPSYFRFILFIYLLSTFFRFTLPDFSSISFQAPVPFLCCRRTTTTIVHFCM